MHPSFDEVFKTAPLRYVSNVCHAITISNVNSQAAQVHNERSYIYIFHNLYANVQRNVTYRIYYYLTIALGHAKRDSRHAHGATSFPGSSLYGGVVLQRLCTLQTADRVQNADYRLQTTIKITRVVNLPLEFLACSRLSVSGGLKKRAGDEWGLVGKKERSGEPVSIVLKTSFRYTSSWYTL